MSRLMSVLFLAAVLTACQKPEMSGFKNSLNMVAAPDKIAASFQIRNTNENGVQGVLIGLKKSSLEKYFLLVPQMRSAGAAGHLNLFEPQVVYFKSSLGQVGLFELNTARIYDDITTDQLLQSFKVKFETEDFIFFDWNYGIEAMVARSPYAGGTSGAKRAFAEGSDSLVDVVQSYIDRAEFKDNVLRVRQISRVRETVLRFRKSPTELSPEDEGVAGDAEKRDSTMAMDLVIRPYDASVKNIEPTTSKLDKGFGYFTRLMASPGTIKPREVIMKWDFSPNRAPIRVRVSKNVPAHLIPAVKEGIEYWNRVVGRKVLALELGVSPQVELEERTVSVHWVDWKDAGFAYAGFQSDPLTGEILQGQIFMTNSWELSGQSYEDLRGSLAHVRAFPAGAKMLNSSCGYHADLAGSWAEVPAVDPVVGESALPHVIRNVVAHEMGHVLGLRHNFAGSFYSTVDKKTHFEKSQEFLKTGVITALPTTISVMDYSNAIDDVMIGKFIQSAVLDYDRQVIAWGYLGDNSLTQLQFCSDGEMDPKKKSIGCEVFDSGATPQGFDAAIDTMTRGRALWRDHAQVMNALQPDAGVKFALDDALNAKEKLVANVPPAANFVAARSLFSAVQPVHSTKHLRDWEKPEDIQKLKQKSYEDQVAALGLVAMFELALPFSEVVDAAGVEALALDQTYWDRQLQRIVTSPKFAKGKNFMGVAYDLSSVETGRLEKYLKLKLGNDPFVPGLAALNLVLPGPEVIVADPETGAPEKKKIVYQKLESLKAEMPEVLRRTLVLMQAVKSVQTVDLGEGKSVNVPTRVFAPALFGAFTALFDPRFNPNADADLAPQLIAALKKDLTDVYRNWGISDTSQVATAELRRLFTEKAATYPTAAKAWINSELTRLEFWEKSLTEEAKLAKPASLDRQNLGI
jgi:hypothetical protein